MVVRGVLTARRVEHAGREPTATDPRRHMVNTPSRHDATRPLACVMGGMDLVRPLALCGIHSAVVARPGSPALYSRFTHSALCRDGFYERDDDLVEALEWLGAAQPQPPVLFYEE